MIKRIQSIKNLGVYSNYTRKGDLPDFNDKNIFYGWNYSGKTTLSRLFSFLENKKVDEYNFPDVDFEIVMHDGKKINKSNVEEFPYLVRVFNSDFIRDNLRFDSEDKKIKGITFDIGDNAHLRPLINTNIDYIEKANKIISNNSKFINDFNQFADTKFTKQAKNIKLEHFNSLIEFNKGHLEKLISTKEMAILSIISDETQLLKIKADSIATNNKDKIEIIDYKLNYEELSKLVSNFIASEPRVSTTIQLLDGDDELYNWVNKGLEIHASKNLDNCAFCNNEILLSRFSELNNYYSNEAAKLKEDSLSLSKLLDDELKLFNSIIYLNLSKNDISESLQSDFESLIESYDKILYKYNALINNLKSAVYDKINYNIFIKQTLKDFDTSIIEEMVVWQIDFKKVIEAHNTIIENFKQNQETARDKYKKHLVSKFLIDEDYFEIKRKKEIEDKYHTLIKKQIISKEKENQEHTNKLKNITAGKKELNAFINQFLKREDILIDVIENDYFVLKRGAKIATNLSEGEKTAIAFSHFLVALNSLHADGKLTNSIIFIDDPISSLDANHIAQVSSMINSFFFRKGLDPKNKDKVVNCFIQFFVSTHNFEFYSFLRDANNIKRPKKELQPDGSKKDVNATNNFLIKKESCDISTIIKTPSSLISYNSEYIYLFSVIYDFFVDGCKEENNNYILMPNAIRRFLEIYTLIKLPGSKDEIDNRIKELVDEVNDLKVLHHFSHFTTFEKVGKQDELILRLPEITEDVFMLLRKDLSHYLSLCKGINKVVV